MIPNGYLIFEDESFLDSTVAKMNALRKSGQFCDVRLQVRSPRAPRSHAPDTLPCSRTHRRGLGEPGIEPPSQSEFTLTLHRVTL